MRKTFLWAVPLIISITALAQSPALAEGETPVEAPVAPPAPETFTVGVSDLTFNPINAVFNRTLILPNGNFVTSAYWKQKSEVSDDKKYYWK